MKCSSATMRFVFNPEHDMCLASGEENFIAPAPVQEFARKCRWIEEYMPVPAEYPFAVAPWGWNSCIRKRLLKEGYPAEELPSEQYIDFVKEHSRRELSVKLHNFLYSGFAVDADGLLLPPGYRCIARSVEEVEDALAKWKRVVLKAPLSGSGKGVRFVSEALMTTDLGWCRNVIARQGAVMVERREELVKEFAMLFECADDVVFAGYSLFYSANGAYRGNVLASNGYIENVLGGFVPAEHLRKCACLTMQFLQERLQGKYRGFVGVDHFFAVGYDSSSGNPCSGDVLWNPAMEINLRTTMGHVARNIFDSHASSKVLGEGTHCFEPERGIVKCG